MTAISDLSAGQLGFFLGYAIAVVLWLASEYVRRWHAPQGAAILEDEDVAEAGDPPAAVDTRPDKSSAAAGADNAGQDLQGPRPDVESQRHEGTSPHRRHAPTSPSLIARCDAPEAQSVAAPEAPASAPAPAPAVQDASLAATCRVVFAPRNPLFDVLLCRAEALSKHNACLRSICEFGAHMLFYFVCDRTDLFPEPGEKFYSRDFFFFLYILLIMFSAYTSLRQTKDAKYLNRDQTEEWKGWMQVLFLMYHYFEAKEQYNSIRVYIAGYVWMTGFGNFSFYYVKKDFSPGRFMQMMWRLNFLVFWVCVVLNNDYVLYYICPMHTLWTFAVYFSLLIFSSYNTNQWVLHLKFIICAVLSTVLWFDGVFFTIWRPFQFVVGFTDPRYPDNDTLHEWFFRSGLDRYVWIFGMICANYHPTVERGLHWIDSLDVLKRSAVRGAVVVVLLAICAAWVSEVLLIDGHRAYNSVHPYTSFIPIGAYIILRNLTPTLRTYYLGVFSWLGKITLETYIGQFHIWLHTGKPNYSPKTLLTILDGYQYINLALTSVVYVWVSYRIFLLTNDLKMEVLPSKDTPRMYRNILLMVVSWLLLYGVGCGVSQLL